MRCPACDKPIRVFLVDGDPVRVDQYPRMGTLRRLNVINNEATETAEHPGGWVRHQCEGAA
jgi:hypothetical protein